MLIAQLSDLHLVPAGTRAYGTVDTGALLQETLAALLRLDPLPDCVLLTGDLAEAGDAASYARLRTMLEPLPMPCYLLPGNHDDRAALCSEFSADGQREQRSRSAARTADGFVQYTVEHHAVRLVMLDTTVPGASHGALCAARLAWLQATLEAQPARPTLIAMHHPPFATGLADMDSIGLRSGAAALDALVRAHGHVEGIVCGHVHRPITQRFGGTLAYTCPSSAHQVALDLRAQAPAAFILEPPGFLLHLWRNGVLVTHYAAVHAEGPAQPF